MYKLIQALSRDQRGATAIEYGLIISLICLGAMGAIIQVADVTTSMWNNVAAAVSQS